MQTREELAALMASEGSSEEKISLLKRAVVAVTRQKQAAEAQCEELRQELETARTELEALQSERVLLTQRLLTVEEAAKNSGLGQHMLKSLSSLVGGESDGLGGGSGGGGGGGPRGQQGKRKRGAPSAAPPEFNSEDLKHIVADNESLHKELFNLKSQLADERKSHAAQLEKLEAERNKLSGELADVQGLLSTTTQSFDDLNAEVVFQRAYNSFCRFFLALQLQPAPHSPSGLTLTVRLAEPPAEEIAAAVNAGTMAPHLLSHTTQQFSLLLLAVSNLSARLSSSLARGRRLTVGDVANYSRLLGSFHDLHGDMQRTFAALFEQLQSAAHVSSPDASGDALVADLTRRLLAAVSQWLHAVAAHAPLLVECCTSLLAPPPQGPSDGAAAALEPSEQAERASKHLICLLTSLKGCVEAVSGMMENACDLFSALPPTLPGRTAWMLTLLMCLAQGSVATPDMVVHVEGVMEFFRLVADGCDDSVIRDSVNFLSAELAGWHKAGVRSATIAAAAAVSARDTGANPSHNSTFADASRGFSSWSPDTRALMSALAAADSAAVLYHAQTQELLLELAAHKDAALALQRDAEDLRMRLADKTEEAERTRHVMQLQIQALSDQLTASPAQ